MTPEEAERFQEILDEIYFYVRDQLLWDLGFVLHSYVGPVLIALLALHGCLVLLRAMYKFIVPPGAAELHW